MLTSNIGFQLIDFLPDVSGGHRMIDWCFFLTFGQLSLLVVSTFPSIALHMLSRCIFQIEMRPYAKLNKQQRTLKRNLTMTSQPEISFSPTSHHRRRTIRIIRAKSILEGKRLNRVGKRSTKPPRSKEGISK